MDELIGEIIAWQRQTFPDSTVRGTLRHMGEEIVETYFAHFSPHVMQFETAALINLMKEKVKEEEAQLKDRDYADEVADLLFMAIQAADHAGLNVREILSKKLETNKARKWTTDEHEVNRHVPG